MRLFADSILTPISSTQSIKYDCIVVGSGTAGISSAINLAKAGFNVLIIEAGPFILPAHIGSLPIRTQDNLIKNIEAKVTHPVCWNESANENSQPNNLIWSAVGGRTLFWGGLAPRFKPQDFNSWPISYRE